MQVPAGRRNRPVAQRGLHQMNRRTPVERVAWACRSQCVLASRCLLVVATDRCPSVACTR